MTWAAGRTTGRPWVPCTSVGQSDEALNVVSTPVDHDVFGSDTALVDAVRRYDGDHHLDRLRDLGRLAGSARAARWADLVHRFPPRLQTYDPFGRRIDEVEHHPAWHRLLHEGVRAGLSAAPWGPDAPAAAHLGRAAGIVVWSQAESNHIAALTTTYATVPTLRSEPGVAEVWAPRLASGVYEAGLRPARKKLGCLTGIAIAERQGGSDLQSSTTVASPEPEGPVEAGEPYRLNGNKWFVSSPMSDAFLVLAQAPGGLTCFLVPRVLDDGSLNSWRIHRLKDKVGNRPNASAEVGLDDTWGVRIGMRAAGCASCSGPSRRRGSTPSWSAPA